MNLEYLGKVNGTPPNCDISYGWGISPVTTRRPFNTPSNTHALICIIKVEVASRHHPLPIRSSGNSNFRFYSTFDSSPPSASPLLILQINVKLRSFFFLLLFQPFRESETDRPLRNNTPTPPAPPTPIMVHNSWIMVNKISNFFCLLSAAGVCQRTAPCLNETFHTFPN